MSSRYTVRCGRRDGHEPHQWSTPGSVLKVGRTYDCTGHVVVTVAEREWADRADFNDRRDDELREWLRDAWTA